MSRTARRLALFLAAAASSAVFAQGVQIPAPSEGLMPSATRGKALYEANCAACHGGDLRGTYQGPPMLHKFYESAHHGDQAFQAAARFGVRAHHWRFGNMPPVAGVSADDVAHVTAYIRSEQRKVGID